MSEVGLTEHVTVNGLEEADSGFVKATCRCGFELPPVPDAETATDALMEHVSLAVQTAIRRTP